MATPILSVEVGPARLDVVVADITTLAVDAIVNAANTSLLGGGGVDGAIHRAAGGYKLPAKHVIHAVGPVWSGGARGEADLLASCYRTALMLAAEHELQSIA